MGRALTDADAPMPSPTSLARRCHRVVTVAASSSAVSGRLRRSTRRAGSGADLPSLRRAATLAPAAPPPRASLGCSGKCIPGLLLRPVPPAAASSADFFAACFFWRRGLGAGDSFAAVTDAADAGAPACSSDDAMAMPSAPLTSAISRTADQQ